MRRWSVLGVVLLAGCGAAAVEPAAPPRPPVNVVTIGRPVAGGELRAATPGGGPRWFGGVVTPPRGRPRDVCVTTGLVVSRREGNVSCDVAVSDRATSFVEVVGIPDRYGRPPTVVSGVAPPGVRVRVQGPGGAFDLPLSAHRAFLAVYPPGLRGRLRVVSVRAEGTAVRSVRLPLRPRMTPHHLHRRPGAIFNDEIGENVLSLFYRQVVRRYGRPAAVSGRCSYYELVGWKNRGWLFCFARDGHMTSAAGNSHRPAS